MSRGADPLSDFRVVSFTADGATRDVYVQGDGPGVIVIAEVPGITPEVADFARRVAASGQLSVWLPVLFGTPGEPRGVRNTAAVIAQACISREFAVWASDRSSPIVAWLRQLARHVHATQGGPGVGAVGMCLTGNFALSMLVEPSVIAPVLSQASLPFALPGLRDGLHASPDELAEARRRVDEEGLEVLALRFTWDAACPAARYDHLERALGRRGVRRHDIPSHPGNPSGHSVLAHSVLTNDLIDAEGEPSRAALDDVLAFFHDRLVPQP